MRTTGAIGAGIFLCSSLAHSARQIDLAVDPPALTIWGATGTSLGRGAGIGDLNGDGRLDFAVSEGTSTPRICLYFGPFPVPLEIDNAVASPATCINAVTWGIGDRMLVTDLDGDGMAELITSGGGTSRGAVTIFRGRLLWPNRLNDYEADWAFTGAEVEDYLGAVTAGDINGDGFNDLILFAFAADGVGNLRYNAGEAYIFFGPTSRWKARYDLAVDSPDTVIYGADGLHDRNPGSPGSGNGDLLGAKGGSIVADVIGDAIPDLILESSAAYGPANLAEDFGEIHVLRGRATWPSALDLRNPSPFDLVIYGPAAPSLLHRPAAADLDGDGKNDLIVGAPRANQGTGRRNAGALFIFRGGTGLRGVWDLATTPADATIVGATVDGGMGWQVVTGDVNGDGFADIVTAGNPDSPLGRLGAGTISVISGFLGFPKSRDLASSPADLTFLGADDLDQSGEVLALGDIDGDGETDILSASYHASSLGSARPNGGEAHLILGRPFDAACAILPDPGLDVQTCGVVDVPLDGRGTTVTGCSVAPQYRWLEAATVIRDWSADPAIVVRPLTTTSYRLEVRCGDCAGPCFASATIVVTVVSDVTPPTLGNALYAVRRGADVELSWGSLPEASTYSVYRSLVKDIWPPLPSLEDLLGATVSLPDIVVPPNDPQYFYRASGASCSGVEGP